MAAHTVSFGGYRVAGVMLNRGKVLLSTDKQVDFWVLPGGSVKPFESSEEAIKREFREEIGVEIEVVRLLWIVENSFVFDNLKVHGIGLDFLVEPMEWKGKITHEAFSGLETDYKVAGTRYEHIEELELTFRWFDITELDTIEIRPKVYHEALRQIPEHPVLLRNLEVKR
jgi:8-oxo-dGTP pyrophosphatase MutT (NUDIX family)